MGFKAYAKAIFRLGCLGFGGPAAVLSMIEEEFSRKRGWISVDRFSHLLTVCKLFPGPAATQMVIALGRIHHGVWGALTGGLIFILPAFSIVLALSAWYQQSAEVLSRAGLFWPGVQTGAIAAILGSVIQLARPYRKDIRAWIFGSVSAAVVAWRPQLEPLLILSFGLISYGGYRFSRSPMAMSLVLSISGLVDEAVRSKLLQIFWVCFKAGAFVFGTGLAVVPVLEADFVGRMGWLTHAQFMDGLAVGQITPGPVTITATFLGYQVLGLPGAMVATLGVFLAAFINGTFTIPRIWGHLGSQGAEGAASFIAGAVPAVVGGVLGMALRLSLQTWRSSAAHSWAIFLVFFVASLAILWRKLPAGVVILGAGGLAWALGLGTHFF